MPRDNGESTFDRYRSTEAVAVGPQGIDLQLKAQADTTDELEQRYLAREKQYSEANPDSTYFRDSYKDCRYNKREWEPGGMTFRKGEVIG